MCGLLGVAVQKGSSLSPDLAGYLLTRLMHSNEVRGGDSYGLGVVVPETKDVKLYKTVGRISAAGLANRTWRSGVLSVMDAIDSKQTVVAMGHNRKATTGKNTERNAHPFLCGKLDRNDFVLGAHNGVISPWQEIIDAWDLKSCEMEVDSEVLFRGMQKFADLPDADIKVLGEIYPLGMVASTYMRDLNTLNLYQGDNPLSIAVGDGFILWSSLKIHLDDHTFGLNVKTQIVGAGSVARVDLDTFKIKTQNVPSSPALQQIIDPPFKGTSYLRPYGVFQGRGRYQYEDRRSTYDYRRTFGLDPDDGDVSKVEEKPKPPAITHLHPNASSAPYGYSYDTAKEIPKLSVSASRNKADTTVCECCKGYGGNASDDTIEEVEHWELLWYRGEGLCTTCYYFMVQSEAEEELQSRMHG